MKSYFLLLVLLLVGCSTLPVNIENPPAFDLAYSYANQYPDRYKNLPIRWGGVIAEVENQKDASLLQILSYPLDSYGRPLLNETAQGRFVVKSNQFLDPLVYATNTEITVAGTLTGSMQRTIGQKEMRLPLVLSSTLYLWPVYDYSNTYYGGYGYGGYYGGFSPYYGYGSRYGFGFSPFYGSFGYGGFPHHGGRGGRFR